MGRGLTQAEFLQRAQEVHGDKYDYSKAVYVNTTTKIIIGCKVHGDFLQTPATHLKGSGCKKCVVEAQRWTQARFIEEARAVHGDKYDYSKVVYTGQQHKVIIICPIHGEFSMRVECHVRQHQGCPACGDIKIADLHRDTLETFVEKATKVHGNKYDYSNTVYTASKASVNIVCPIHGEFIQKATDHMSGRGCPKCGRAIVEASRRFTLDDFVQKSKAVHGHKYDYSKVQYSGIMKKVTIICPIHGEFQQIANDHVSGYGCAKCGRELAATKYTITTDEFIKAAKSVHGDRYDYSKTVYIGNKKKVIIICLTHGEFLQTPHEHLDRCGCPKCKRSIGEELVESYLKSHRLWYKWQYRDARCVVKRELPFDFAIFSDKGCKHLQTIIEFDGALHYKAVGFFGGEDGYERTKKYDAIKTQFCTDNNIPLIRIPYYEIDNIAEILDRELNTVYNQVTV